MSAVVAQVAGIGPRSALAARLAAMAAGSTRFNELDDVHVDGAIEASLLGALNPARTRAERIAGSAATQMRALIASARGRPSHVRQGPRETHRCIESYTRLWRGH